MDLGKPGKALGKVDKALKLLWAIREVCLPIPFSPSKSKNAPFLDAGKGNCCMWPVNQVEVYFAKIGFVDSKWSNLNAPGSYTP